MRLCRSALLSVGTLAGRLALAALGDVNALLKRQIILQFRTLMMGDEFRTRRNLL